MRTRIPIPGCDKTHAPRLSADSCPLGHASEPCTRRRVQGSISNPAADAAPRCQTTQSSSQCSAMARTGPATEAAFPPPAQSHGCSAVNSLEQWRKGANRSARRPSCELATRQPATLAPPRARGEIGRHYAIAMRPPAVRTAASPLARGACGWLHTSALEYPAEAALVWRAGA